MMVSRWDNAVVTAACELRKVRLLQHDWVMTVQVTRQLGRPSKGDRVGLFIRVPRPLARQFVEDAAAVGNSQSDQMALILATWYGSSPTAPAARAGADMVVLASGRQAEAIAHRAWVGGYLRPANAARWTRTAAPVALIR